jgi:hypothetical protein
MEKQFEAKRTENLQVKYSRLVNDETSSLPLKELGAANIEDKKVVKLLFDALEDNDHDSYFSRKCHELGKVLKHSTRYTRLHILALQNIMDGQNWERIGGWDPRSENEEEVEAEKLESRGLTGSF